MIRHLFPRAPAEPTRTTATDPALEYELAALILEYRADSGRVTISDKLARRLAVLARREARRLRSGGA